LPVVGRFRDLFITLGEFFRQYFFAMVREEMPFNRAERTWINRAERNVDNTIAFGSSNNLRALPAGCSRAFEGGGPRAMWAQYRRRRARALSPRRQPRCGVPDRHCEIRRARCGDYSNHSAPSAGPLASPATGVGSCSSFVLHRRLRRIDDSLCLGLIRRFR
jgi:hypothetical protein